MKITNKLSLDEITTLAEESFGDFVKAVVDIERGIISIGGELHSDEESMLLDDGSRQEDLWGINIYPALPEDKRVEFDSMINIRPKQNNRSRGIDRPEIRERILLILKNIVD